jgi:hypothetical protein
MATHFSNYNRVDDFYYESGPCLTDSRVPDGTWVRTYYTLPPLTELYEYSQGQVTKITNVVGGMSYQTFPPVQLTVDQQKTVMEQLTQLKPISHTNELTEKLLWMIDKSLNPADKSNGSTSKGNNSQTTVASNIEGLSNISRDKS